MCSTESLLDLIPYPDDWQRWGQGLDRGSEENTVDEVVVLVSEGSDLFGNRGHDAPLCGAQSFVTGKVCNLE